VLIIKGKQGKHSNKERGKTMREASRKHKLLTKEMEKRFAQVGCQDGKGCQATVVAKFFNPYGVATWLATEYDPETRNFYGFVNLMGADLAEWGPFSLDELEQARVRIGGVGLPLERDCYWKEKPMCEAMEEIGCADHIY